MLNFRAKIVVLACFARTFASFFTFLRFEQKMLNCNSVYKR